MEGGYSYPPETLLRVAVPVGVTRVGRALETVNPGEEVEGRERSDDSDVEVDSS